MAALVLVISHLPLAPLKPRAQILSRARGADGVVVFVTAPAHQPAYEAPDEDAEAVDSAGANAPGGAAAAAVRKAAEWAGKPAPVQPPADDLVLASEVPDVFDGVEDLATGLQAMNIDRVVIGGVDQSRAVEHTVMAALVLGFEATVLADALVGADGAEVQWLETAAGAGARIADSADTWLRM